MTRPTEPILVTQVSLVNGRLVDVTLSNGTEIHFDPMSRAGLMSFADFQEKLGLPVDAGAGDMLGLEYKP